MTTNGALRGYLLAPVVGVLALGAGSAFGADCPAGFPSQPINFYVGFAAGGGTDAIARSIAQAIEQKHGWTIVVENRPGAASGVMSRQLLNMDADGHNIGLASSDTMVWNPSTGELGYHYSDFDFLGSAMDSWNSLASLSVAPFDDLPGLIEYARDRGMASVAVAGFNQTLVVDQLAQQYEVNLVPVPVEGSSESMMLTLGGHVDATIQGVMHLPELRSGNMKMLASATTHRLPYAPDVGTMEEQGAQAIPIVSSTIFIAPKGLDPEISACLQATLDEAVDSEEFGRLIETFDNAAVNHGAEGIYDLIAERDTQLRTLFGGDTE